jgi:ATP-binding cassette subfamily B protein
MEIKMIFGKHINGYYIRYLPLILIGILSLVVVDYMQLIIPELYRALVNGMTYGYIEEGGERIPFDISYLLDEICLPLIIVIVTMIICRFLWRVCFRAAAVKMETNMRSRMFDHCKGLSLQYYQVNKVGNMMSLFTNDLSTINECFGDGTLMLIDAVALTGLAIYKMSKLDPMLTVLAFIPMLLLFAVGSFVGKYMTKKW